MKKILLSLFVFVIASGAKQSYAQPWAISGASWYYDFYNPFPTATGYIHIQKLGDSLVSSKVCDKLQVFTKWWSAVNSAYDSSSTYEFTYQQNDTVFYYSKSNNTFYILYDFNAIQTNIWNVYSDCSAPNDMTDTISVDSIGTTIINGDTLKHLWTSCTNQYGYQFWNKIVERIGGMGYLFPYPMCLLDQPNPPTLRCYSDSTGWFYQADSTQLCNYIYIQVQEVEFFNSLSLSPNPAWDKLQITISKFQNEEIVAVVFDVMGKQVDKKQSAVGNKTTIDISFLEKGVYYLKVSSEGVTAVKKFIKM